MATYALIPGAAHGPWYWHLLATELRRGGHDVVAVDLPCDDESAGLAEYADAAEEAVAGRHNLTLVAHSFGGFTAPLVCQRRPVDLLVLVAAQVPAPGESPAQWWANTGFEQARREQDETLGGPPEDEVASFYHDAPAELAREATRRLRAQTVTPFLEPWPLESWPDVPKEFLLARDDRFFPAEFLRRVVKDRLDIEPAEMPGDHCPMLSHPVELAHRLESWTAWHSTSARTS